MLPGILFALAAGLLWGLVFIAPLLLPDYPAALLSLGRYLAFGLIALPLAWLDRAALRGLSRADWARALELALIGNLLYYLCLAAAIQRAGAPLPTMIIGTLPVVIAVVAKLGGEPVPWRRLVPSLVLIGAGIACVNQAELVVMRAAMTADASRHALGALLAVAAVACWTWYPMRNAAWLRGHPNHSPRTWATAQGLATLPLALAGYAAIWSWQASGAPETLWLEDFPMPLGWQPARFLALMVALGLLASWLGTLCWNEASRRLPATLAGQLIVFETLSALAYAFLLRGTAPEALTMLGAALLVAGVARAARG
jgi:drug/metabolite transporter (DMT)-like permease